MVLVVNEYVEVEDFSIRLKTFPNRSRLNTKCIKCNLSTIYREFMRSIIRCWLSTSITRYAADYSAQLFLRLDNRGTLYRITFKRTRIRCNLLENFNKSSDFVIS